MSEREKILRFYRAGGQEALAARLIDLAENTLKTNKYKVSEFLDPYGHSIAETVSAHYDRINLVACGGYNGAERVKAAFVEADFAGKVDFSLAALAVRVDVRYYEISHRDVLGAIVALGVKRELIGDIIMDAQGCEIITDASLATFITENLSRINNANIEIEEIDLDRIVPKDKRVKEIKSTVASLRLDVVAAAGFSVSRTKMASEIAADKLKLNWQEVKSASQTVKAGDIISMRGRGRVEVCEILGQTKKGRTSIFLKRFI